VSDAEGVEECPQDKAYDQ
jgi:hypothetical protein